MQPYSGGQYDTPYMHQLHLESIKDLPVPDAPRKSTDVCCLIIALLFGLALFILACVLINRSNLNRSNFPADTKGNICMLDTNQSYPFLYFADVANPNSNRYCLSQCPQEGAKPQCFTQCSIGYYPNYPVSNELGSYCMPTDASAQSQLIANSNLYTKWNDLQAIRYLLAGVGISIALAFIWMVLVQFLPRIMVWVAVVLAVILLLVTAIVLFTSNGQGNALQQAGGWNIVLGLLCIAIMIAIIFYACVFRARLSVAGAFLEQATKFVSENKKTLLWIPLFIIFTFLFGILIVFEYLAYVSSTGLSFDTKNLPFYQLSKPGFLIFLLVIQTIWGYSFIRDSFNYIISGTACDWYFGKESNCCQPPKRLVSKNLGSVYGGSFLSGFFYIPALFVDLMCPTVDFTICNFFDLIREQAYSYIYLTGNSYCPSVRQVQYLCNRSPVCRQNESTISIYTLCARIVVALASVLIIFWITRDNAVGYQVPPYLMLGIFFIGLYNSNWFIDIHGDAAQALMVCFLADYELEGGFDGMVVQNKGMKAIIGNLIKQEQQARFIKK